MMFDDLLSQSQLSRKGQTLDNSGIDSEGSCFDLQWYKSFPHPISYQINSMGFRDRDHGSLEGKVFAIGDSFTMGIGQPYEHTWPVMLENLLGEEIVKLAGDGVSNDWIQRVLDKVIEMRPKAVFVMLTFVHRELIKNSEGIKHLHYDEDASFYHPEWNEKMLDKTKEYLEKMRSSATRLKIPVFFTAVPEFDMVKRSPEVRGSLIQYPRLATNVQLTTLKRLNDLARDGFHFGKRSCEDIAKNLYTKYKEEMR